jgi:hypothetical protein
MQPFGRTRACSQSATDEHFRDAERRRTDHCRCKPNAIHPKDTPLPLFDTPRRVRENDVSRTNHCVTRRTGNYFRALTHDDTGENLLDRRRRDS